MFYTKQAYRRTHGNLREQPMRHLFQRRRQFGVMGTEVFFNQMENRLDKTLVSIKVIPNIYHSATVLNQLGILMNHVETKTNKKKINVGDTLSILDHWWGHYQLQTNLAISGRVIGVRVFSARILRLLKFVLWDGIRSSFKDLKNTFSVAQSYLVQNAMLFTLYFINLINNYNLIYQRQQMVLTNTDVLIQPIAWWSKQSLGINSFQDLSYNYVSRFLTSFLGHAKTINTTIISSNNTIRTKQISIKKIKFLFFYLKLLSKSQELKLFPLKLKKVLDNIIQYYKIEPSLYAWLLRLSFKTFYRFFNHFNDLEKIKKLINSKFNYTKKSILFWLWRSPSLYYRVNRQYFAYRYKIQRKQYKKHQKKQRKVYFSKVSALRTKLLQFGKVMSKQQLRYALRYKTRNRYIIKRNLRQFVNLAFFRYLQKQALRLQRLNGITSEIKKNKYIYNVKTYNHLKRRSAFNSILQIQTIKHKNQIRAKRYVSCFVKISSFQDKKVQFAQDLLKTKKNFY